MQHFTEAGYSQAKTALKDFEVKNLDEYYDIYIQIDIILLANIFGNFQNKCLEICELDPGYFFTAPRLAW